MDPTFAHNIVTALSSSLNPNNDIRKEAEAFLKQVSLLLFPLIIYAGTEDPRVLFGVVADIRRQDRELSWRH